MPYSFSLSQTLDCGQSFRWKVYNGVGGTDPYGGMVGDDFVFITQRDENTIVFHDTDLPSFDRLWKVYFDLERDYGSLQNIFARDAVLSKALKFCGGIRVLRQPRWETLCSYIISQNNNIPRIKSLIGKICASFGTPVRIKRPDGTLDEEHSFPEPEVLAGLNASDLEKLGFGYRAPYVVCAARAVASGELNLDAVAEMPINEARAELRKLLGVGPKVAECSLLYGFGRDEAFPVDTWIKTVMSEFYPSGLPEFVKPYAGIAQIYLFHYIRNR
ncbi:MAG: hypothetical protein FWG09_05225 [Synergistaceae bacterium]|nr:hypothetical protein [Synergistaceae bacterium]